MRLRATYILFNEANGRYLPENMKRTVILEIDESGKSDLDKLVISELSKTIRKPQEQFKLLSCLEL